MITPKWVKGISPAPRPSEGRGERLERGGYGRPLFGILTASFVCLWGQGPTDAQRPGPFVWEGGLLRAPSQALFHTARFCPAPGFFFVFFLAFGATLRN